MITIGVGDNRLNWLCEMQALAKNDANTLATALIASVAAILNIMTEVAASLSTISCAAGSKR